MLSDKTHLQQPLVTHTFLVTIELEEGRSPEKVSWRLADSLAFVEGIGHVDVIHQGALEQKENTQ